MDGCVEDGQLVHANFEGQIQGQTKSPKSASPIWRAVESTKLIILKGACYLIGEGASINVWIDSWVPGFKPKPRNQPLAQCPIMVSQFIRADQHALPGTFLLFRSFLI